MALDKLVDSGQLDSDLEDVADAIRAKGGTSASLAFPAGFVQAIADIPSGGGGDYTAADWLDLSKPTGAVVSDSAVGSSFPATFQGHTGITSVHLTTATAVPSYFCQNATSLETFVGRALAGSQSSLCFGCSSLTAMDILGGGTFSSDLIRNCPNFTTLVLRASTITSLGAQTFRGSVFASGSGGGTIYIPKSLYDHLGDNSSLDYKAATNWSTIDGYGTITWAKIEGSIYENAYADGTPIT